MNKKTIIAAAMLAFAPLSYASILFQFTEVGGNVKMTSSGTLDTTKLVSTVGSGWGGTGIENNGTPGDIDIMGSTDFGSVDTWFTFNVGTDFSAITSPNGPFSSSEFGWTIDSGNNSFATYAGFNQSFRIPGIGVRSADIVGGLWTPDQIWTNAGDSFASLGMNVGIYSVSDSRTGETITIQVGNGSVSVPDSGATLALLGACLVSLAAFRRRFAA